ncbi:hydrogenase maturation protein HypF [Butyrivibrio fibrisolvens DSM 3071]|uniref:acylphosphatase n=1 Tax=Butyrivibrio fibrisolvens DSM 3071 TaxID=1121131 RepID=A0A1M5YMX8_BUTFI|nr:carbamoyltransferase HypF [Butyrivibrio fibrisolvens]SHI12923.1 hydrogenase maturation protein HypF [Butyrivibrio fibrisolvens DSM 3071]
MNRYVRITIKGLVQGIGFRPFVAECAEELNIGGIVRNSGGIVIIYACADDDSLNKFTCNIESYPPYGAVINSISSEEISKEVFDEECAGYIEIGVRAQFKIVDSRSHKDKVRLLPPDLPVCDRCVEELLDINNNRYRYPFISCTSCGPRFSIMHTVPYDRDTTTMDMFEMCPDCFNEYTKRGDVRRHAQTISCHKCGPQLKFEDVDMDHKGDLFSHTISVEEKHSSNQEKNISSKKSIDNNNNHVSKVNYTNEIALQKAVKCINEGKIGAVLDIGGFHFVFSPYMCEPARRLRAWKNRESKPFAVMFSDIDSIKKYCEVSEKEEEILRSNPRPIVLLDIKDVPDEDLPFAKEVLAGSDRIGAMLPCSPLQFLLLKETGPLVMTSGNRGGEPIVTDPGVMKEYLGTGGPDFMLSHERKILTPLDDSIYQVNGDVVQIIRRARGLVPWPVDLPFELKEETFAAGGDLKAVFALGKADKAYLSAHFSDLDDLEAANARDKAVSHMQDLLDIKPERYVCDKHPGYISVKKAENMAGGSSNVLQVQHHLSHVMAAVCEHDIKGTFVGIAYDGTGYGDDGSIWGSEFFLCNIEDAQNGGLEDGDLKNRRNVSVKHMGSLLPVKMTGGDESSKDAAKTLFCYLHEAEGRGYIDKKDIELVFGRVKDTFKDDQIPDIRLLEAALDHDINTIRSSSMGRLFDAVSALLGICCYNTYEGECPAKLEICARKAHNLAKSELKAANTNNLVKVNTSVVKANELTKIEPDAVIISDLLNLEIKIIKNDDFYYLDGSRLIADMCRLIASGEDKEVLALSFHKALSDVTVKLAERIIKNSASEKELSGNMEVGDLGQIKLAISGGSFLNRILNTDIQTICKRKGYELYQNSIVPPGDGGIALGQLYLSQCVVRNNV